MYTGYDYNKNTIRNYTATPYASKTPVAYRTTKKTIYHTVILRSGIDSSNFEDGDKVFALEDDKTIFLLFNNFVPQNYGSEVSLCQVLNENDNITHDIVLTPGTGFQVKYNGSYETFSSYDSTTPIDYCLISINKNTVGINREYASIGLSDMPSSPKIKINAPTVILPSNWAIQIIAASDNGELKAGYVDYQIFMGGFYD